MIFSPGAGSIGFDFISFVLLVIGISLIIKPRLSLQLIKDKINTFGFLNVSTETTEVQVITIVITGIILILLGFLYLVSFR
ncbi:hypothetical protein [Natranaerobius thermophilus]|uniref:hypothetical protein n=1 Tax=Natranaerobius thermophilus TaxID=375929 RepID=UPI0001664BCD|nr:hypothetical protein [Natranaerobius thermophilus]